MSSSTANSYFTTLFTLFYMRRILLLALSCVLVSTYVSGQIAVDATMTPAQLVQNVLLGGGVTVSNVKYNGVASPATVQVGSGSFTGVGTNLGLAAGLILSTGEVDNAVGPATNFSGDANMTGSDPDLELISAGDITDRAVLEFDFVPTGDSLKFRYVFASEEYPEFICSYNDAFGFFLSGPGISGPYVGNAANIALVPGTTIPVTINNVNNGLNNNPNDPTCPAVNAAFYVDNENGVDVSYDGFTVVLEAFALVQCGQVYHIKLAVGDAGGLFGGDTTYDSAVFLEAGSFTSTGQVTPQLVSGVGVIGTTMMEGCVPVELVFTRQGDLSAPDTISITVSGTATPGVDYSPALPNALIYAADDSLATFVLTVPIDPDGPETIVITVNQVVSCSGSGLTTVYTFNIDSPPVLTATLADIDVTCGDVNVLEPLVEGGLGYYAFLWSTGETTPAISVSPSQTTTYTYTISDSCAVEPLTGSVTVTLPVLDPLVITVTPQIDIPCLETDVVEVLTVSGGNGVYAYQWSQGGNNLPTTQAIVVPAGPPTWYVVEVQEGCGSSVQDSVLVSQAALPPIAITTSGSVIVICPGDTTQLAITEITGGNGVYTIEWTNSSNAVVSTDYTVDVGVPADASYTISVADQCGTQGTAQISTFLPHYQQMQIFTNPDHRICYGESTVAQVSVQGGSGYFFIDWIGQDHTDPILAVQPTEETTYQVQVTDRCGAVRSNEVTVEVEAVYIDIAVNNQGQDDWFLQAATIPRAASYVWDWGDGFKSRANEVGHSFTDLEDHWVYLKVVTPNGCTARDSVLLTAPAHIYFPNAFTPDGDGVNETFGPVGHSIDEFHMVVFNRWGELLYSTEDLLKPWDGKVNGGKVANTGVYVYKYRAAGHYFPATEGYGSVTLIRGTQE